MLWARDVVKVSDFGYDPADSTRFIQQALDAGAKTVILDRQAGPWVTLPLLARSNTEFIVEPGVELLAKRGEFRGKRDYLFNLHYVTNFTLRGGEGSTFRMWKRDYQKPPYERGEWRYTLRIDHSVNVLVENMRFVSSGGDGITIGKSKGVTVRNCVCEDNHRQGLTLGSGEDVLIENTVMRNTSGTPPQAGVDIEPDHPYEKLSNCTLRNCLVEGNAGNGYEIYLDKLNTRSAPVSITFENCRSVGNLNSAFVNGGNLRQRDFVKGFVRFVNCSFEQARNSGIVVKAKPAAAFDVSFRDCTISNAVGGDVLFGAALISQGPPDGIQLENITVLQPTNRPWFTSGAKGIGPAAQNIAGTVRIVSPTGESRAETLDAGWVARNQPAVNGGKLPPDKLHIPSADCVEVVDAKPGQPVEMPPIAFFHGARLMFFAERPGPVHFVARQINISPNLPSNAKPLAITYINPDVRPSRKLKWSLPAPGLQAETIVFDAPRRGFYTLRASRGRTRFRLESSDVPVAANVTDGQCGIAAIDHSSYSLWFTVQGGRPFSVLAAPGSASALQLAVSDPSGDVRAKAQVANDLHFANFEADAPAGLWRADIAPAAGRNLEFATVDIYGAPGFLFLSPEKTWRMKETTENRQK